MMARGKVRAREGNKKQKIRPSVTSARQDLNLNLPIAIGALSIELRDVGAETGNRTQSTAFNLRPAEAGANRAQSAGQASPPRD